MMTIFCADHVQITTARQASGKQHVLITPQAMGDVDKYDDVKVIK